ncbi:MAG: thiamine phosphate synthase, partial [Armatimonadota bacterium]
MLRGVCVITAAGLVPGRTHVDVAKAAVEAEAEMVQLRDKQADTRELYDTAVEVRRVTRGTRTLFIVNDRVDVALAVGADGVHVGDRDLPPEVARRLMGSEAIVGVSAATPEEAVLAARAGAIYIVVGPMFSTATKSDAGEPVGPHRIVEVKAVVDIPVLGIGGIDITNAHTGMAGGAEGVAVISAVAGAADMVAA